MTRICEATREVVLEAAALIRSGELVGMPTETVYGLAANALSERAALKVFEAKGRPADNPLIVHVNGFEQIPPLIRGAMSEHALRLANAFWPGPLTMIFKKSDLIPDAVTAGMDTVAIRIPKHPVARALILESGLPIAAPSANRSGRPSPTSAKHVLDDMDGRISMILDGGTCEVGLESTVLDISSDPVRVLRPGGVSLEMIRTIVPDVQLDPTALSPLEPGEEARSPGMKYKHYAPTGHLTVVRGSPERVAQAIIGMYDRAVAEGKSAAILAPGAHATRYGHRVVRPLSSGESIEEIASELFLALREMDEQNVEAIFAEAVDTAGLGLAVMNRLARAAGFHIIDAEA